MFRIIGIDPGWSHLALVVIDVDLDSYDVLRAGYKYYFNVVHAKMTDLRHMKCTNPNECMFETGDRKGGHLVHHFVESMHEWFSTADKIIIESQPIMSTHKDIEQLLLVYVKQRHSNGKKRHIRLIAPQSMHAHFKMSSVKAERRKEIVEITKEYLKDVPAFKQASIKDHLGDATGFILYYIDTLLEEHVRNQQPNPFEKFKYH